ncbi:MAG TPA: HAMP domain-containing sensor histidine kinase, partial [Candidatus Sulfotelmatobacter sp.]|nr:HAMP domain-containing sensor histidine kinase [Candidatus Sulfotelmatobacter sp.]
GGFAGAVVVGQTDSLPPWWVDAMYGIGVLIGLEAPRFDRRINAPARALARWSMVRMTLPYLAFVPLMVATFFAALIAPATDMTKSLAVTLAVVSGLVAAREMLQVLENRHLAAASLAMLETSRLNEAKVDRLSRAKSEVMSNLSHEFRNALVGIQGFSELMKDQELDPAEVKEFAGDIYTDATRLTRMITEMLDVDRMDAGRITLALKPLDLNAKVRDAVERAQLASAKCQIRMQLDPALPPARADDDRIFQVISNLLSNAIKYSPEGGEVLVTTSSSEGKILFSVHDHGIGIAPEDLPRLFQRFERINSAGKQIVGTGLGLVIARQIVELHGGRIWAESTPGVGSEFCFTIPIASPLAPVDSARLGQPTAA